MLSQYLRPQDIDREFWEDYERAVYWSQKAINRRDKKVELCDMAEGVFWYGSTERKVSEPLFYDSPRTGNRWLIYWASFRDERGPHLCARHLCFTLTARYMTVFLPMIIMDDPDEENGERRELQCVNVYTSHLFQRMADPDRLGVEYKDRIRAIQNFGEYVVEGWSDTRPPRTDRGERHTQIILRTPASWFRGHVIPVGNRAVVIYRTFIPDKLMTPSQRRDVRSFARFADGKKQQL